MSEPCIISIAITGSVPRKRDNPALPVTVFEQLESTHAAYEAGAALVHVHVRNDDDPLQRSR
jgi:3-keto-5-aminohexanoate cleavage enzyme